MKPESDSLSEDGLSIGVVARLTGINPDTLRVWERRYNLTTPARAGGRRNRRYSQEDVRRLGTIKSLVDAGHPISSLAALSLPQLEARLREDSGLARTAPAPVEGPIRVVAQGPNLAPLLSAGVAGLQTAAAYAERADFERAAGGMGADVAIIEQPSLQADAATALLRLPALTGLRHWVVVYAFAAESTLRTLEQAGFTCISQPIDATGLRRACLTALGRAEAPAPAPADAKAVPPRRFEADQLARIARAVPTVKCECPRHLVSLVNSLIAFEIYSRECASRNERDREIHRSLHAATAQARAQMELALEELIAFEGVVLD